MFLSIMMMVPVFVLTRPAYSVLHGAAQMCLFCKTSFSHRTSVTINVHLCHRAELGGNPSLCVFLMVVFLFLVISKGSWAFYQPRMEFVIELLSYYFTQLCT